jgi:hypothetical protein
MLGADNRAGKIIALVAISSKHKASTITTTSR